MFHCQFKLIVRICGRERERDIHYIEHIRVSLSKCMIDEPGLAGASLSKISINRYAFSSPSLVSFT